MADDVDLRLKYAQESGDILVTGLQSVINESLRNILGTLIGTRLFNRTFGSRLQELLFEPMSESIARIMIIEIQQAIDRHEPRVRLNSSSEIIPRFDENIYEARIVYDILGSGNSGEFITFLNNTSR